MGGGVSASVHAGIPPPQSRPPWEQAPPPGGDTPREQTPPRKRQPLLRTVRILLECILVMNSIFHDPIWEWFRFRGRFFFGVNEPCRSVYAEPKWTCKRIFFLMFALAFVTYNIKLRRTLSHSLSFSVKDPNSIDVYTPATAWTIVILLKICWWFCAELFTPMIWPTII